MSFLGVQSSQNQSAAQTAFLSSQQLEDEKNKHLTRLTEIGQEAGLPSWASSPRDLSKKQEEYLVLARKEVLEIASFPNKDIRREALSLLRRLFELDPVTSATATDLQEAIKELSKRVAKADSFSIAEQRPLIDAYAAGMECLISHLGRKNIGGVSEKLKTVFLDVPGLLKRLSGEDDLELRLKIKYAMEGAKRLKTDKDAYNFLPIATNLAKIGASGLILLFSGGTAASSAAALALQGGSELYAQARTQWRDSTESWYEKVYLIRLLGRAALPHKSPIIVINELAKFIFEVTKFNPSPMIWVKKKMEGKCSWKVLVSAAHAYEHIIFHYQGELIQEIYRAALIGTSKKGGLFGLLSLKEKTDQPKKTQRGILEVIERISSCKKFKEDPQKSQAIAQAWNEALSFLDQKLSIEMQELFTEQEGLEQIKSKENEERLEEVQAKLQELAQERLRLEQISLDFATALELEDQEKFAKAKNVFSAQQVMQAALEARKTTGIVDSSDPIITKLKQDAREDDYDLFRILMIDPVKTPSGFTYSRAGIEKWLETNPTDPITREPLLKGQLKEDRETKDRVIAKQKEKALASQTSCVLREFAVHAWLFHGVKKVDLPKILNAIRKGAHPGYYEDPVTGNTALHLAAAIPQVAIFQLLLGLSDPESLHFKNRAGETPLSIAEKQGPDHQAIIRQYRSAMAPMNHGQQFHHAARMGMLDQLEKFLENGQLVDEKIDGLTALDWAAREEKWDAVAFLVESGACIQTVGMVEAFTNAARKGQSEVIAKLLEYGMNPKISKRLSVSISLFDLSKSLDMSKVKRPHSNVVIRHIGQPLKVTSSQPLEVTTSEIKVSSEEVKPPKKITQVSTV